MIFKIVDRYIAAKVKAKGPPFLRGEPEAGRWYKIPVEKGVAADGSPFFTYIRRGGSDNTLVVLMGGGISLNEQMAAYPASVKAFLLGSPKLPGFYTENLGPLYEFGVLLVSPKPGIFFAEEPANPFRDWNIIILNYASGDFHTGQNDVNYRDRRGKERVIHHRGYQNCLESMKAALPHVPAAEKLLIAGASAGAFAVPALASDIMDLYPGCDDVTVYADSGLINYPGAADTVRRIWKSPPRLAGAIQSGDMTADWFRMLMDEKGDRIRYLYSCGTQDCVLAAYQNYIDTGVFKAGPESLTAFHRALKEHIARLKGINPRFGVLIHDFPSPNFRQKGVEHCIVGGPRVYAKTPAGVSAMEWLWDGVNGKVYDVGMDLL
jgi:hypothetical protein